MTTPVLTTDQKVAAASNWGMFNADVAMRASETSGLPYYAACALLEKESKGMNVYGHDAGGVFSDPHGARVFVTIENFQRFLIRVMNGETSNGVGPCQITYAGGPVNGHRDGGFFRVMAESHLFPWDVYDNMLFGFKTLKGYHDKYGTWVAAGRIYNGAASYGADLSIKVGQWVTRVGL